MKKNENNNQKAMKNRSFVSVNVCTRCRKNLTLAADAMKITKCAECSYFDIIGVRTIQEYNEWLKKNNVK